MITKPRTVPLAILATVLACGKDPFDPLFDACAGEMATARRTYGAPTAQHRVTMADGRRAIIWDVPSEPGAGLRPAQVAFIWDPAAPGACTFCVPLSPCWPSP